MVFNQKNLFFIKQNEWADSFRTKSGPKLTDSDLQSNTDCICYPCPSDTIKHSLETSQPASLEFSFNLSIV